jgi:hypothetical protein
MPAGFQPIARTAPTVVSGYRSIDQTVSNRVIADVADEILFIEPKSSPLTAILGAVRTKRKATQYRVDWLEKEAYPRKVTVSGAQTSGDTAIETTAGQAARVAANYVMMNLRTREQVLVTAVPDTSTLTVTRGIGGGNAAMIDGDELLFTRAVFEDGADIGTLKSTQEVDNYNYCETVRTPYGWTGRQENTDLYGGKDPVTQRRSSSIEHMKSIEFAFLFGKRHTMTGAGGRLQTFMGGLDYYIASNRFDLNNTEPTLRSFNEWLEVAMQLGPNGKRFGSGTKYLFCSDRWLTVIDGWKEGKLEMKTLDKNLDIEVGELISSHGRVIIVPEPILSDDHAGYAFLLDMGALKYVYHQGRDTRIEESRQGNGEDAYKEELLSDVAIQVEMEMSHGLIYGLPV